MDRGNGELFFYKELWLIIKSVVIERCVPLQEDRLTRGEKSREYNRRIEYIAVIKNKDLSILAC